MKRGIETVLDVLSAGGVRHLFGNPGTTELPLNDALVNDSRFEYILALQEVPLLAMADGYAMASGALGVACVHISCGLGNAMGMLYNAHCEGTPLLVLAGQQDRRLRLAEPVLVGDVVSVARPWTKWSYEVERVEDLPVAVRRAAQIALTPPTGPVFLALPLDLQMEPVGDLDLSAPCVPDRRVRPPIESLRHAADLLAAARRPAILAGSRVTECGGCDELAALAEQLGAPILAECATSHGRLTVASDHPLYAGPLPLWTPDVLRLLSEFDLLFVAGMNLLRLYLYHEPSCPIPADARLIQMDCNAGEVGKNFPVEVGLIGDLKAGLSELSALVAERQTAAARQTAAERVAASGARRRVEQQALLAQIEADRAVRPITALSLMGAVAQALPPRAAVVEEAITTQKNVLGRLGVLKDPAAFFAHRGWALGWGLGCALGVKLAWPDRPVLGLLGDGAAMYGVQGLWSAAHHRIPAVFVICNNAQYKILKVCGDVMPLPELAAHRYVGLDLVGPEIDFVGLAKSLGVAAHRVGSPEELTDRLRDGFASDLPLLIDVPIERT